MAWVLSETEQFPLSPERVQQLYFAEHPTYAAINRASATLMETIGPMLWAALILMSLWAQLFLD